MRISLGWRSGVTALIAVAALVLNACGSGADDSRDGDGEATYSGIKLARTSSLDSGEINDVVGPIEVGPEYNLEMSMADVKDFQSPSTALQVALSGKANIVTGSAVSTLQAIEEGVPVQLFCPQSSGYDTRIVAVGDDITSLEELGEHLDVPIAMEGPGGPVNLLMDQVLRTKDLSYRSSDFTNPTILEDNPARLSALLNGDVRVTVLNAYQVPTIEKELGKENVHVLSNIMADMEGGVVNAGYAASTKWLAENEDAAVAFCASVLDANQQLTEDYEYYKEMSDKYIKPPMKKELIRQNWEAIKNEQLFPFGSDTITKKGVDSLVDVAIENELLTEELAYDDVVNQDILQQAEKMVADNG